MLLKMSASKEELRDVKAISRSQRLEGQGLKR